MIETAVAATVAASAATAPVLVSGAEVGMLAAAGGFIAGWAIVILVVLAIFGILAEHNESSGWAVFWLLLAGAVSYIAFSVSFLMLALAAVTYIVIGVLWSFWRYKRHVITHVEANRTADSRTRERILEQIHPKRMLGTITAWIVIWPFSFLDSFVGDLINFIQSLVTKFFRGIYFKIYDSAVAALK